MTKYLGEESVVELYNVILENFITKEEYEEREKNTASAILTGNAYIAAALLKIAEAISAKGGVGGGTFIADSLVATDEEADEMLDEIFYTEGGIETVESSGFDESQIATDEEAKELLDSIFPVDN